MNSRPSIAVFDVNETLSDMAPMAQRFADVSAAPQLAKTWFASLLRDGFALAAAGAAERFAVLGRGALRTVLADEPLRDDLDRAIDHIMARFASLPVRPDVPEGVRRLRRAGLRLITLTNGSTEVTEQLFARAGIRDEFENLLSVEDAGIWKPGLQAYQYAASACAARLDEMIFVSVHPWDIDGAARAGIATAWVNRARHEYPEYFSAPQLTAASIDHLADQLTSPR